jgi:3-oxosteroid 1-dehydrogenase
MKSRQDLEDTARTSRRRFIRQAAVGAAATVTAGALLGCDDDKEKACEDATTPAGTTYSFDLEVDVVVVGSGTALAGALAAADAGSQVLVLEKAAETGGSTRMSGGVAWIPNNPVMKAAGVEDSREMALEYCHKVAMDQADDEVIEAFVDQGPKMAELVEEHAPWTWRSSGLLTDYQTEWPGAVFKGRSIEPDEAGEAFKLGPNLIDGMASGLHALGGEIRLSTPAVSLISRELDDGRREVLGVVAEGPEGPLRVRANQGVVLAAGGFEWDWEMKRHFLRGPSFYTLGAVTNTGDMIRAAQAVGADLRNMNEVWGITVFKEESAALAEAGEPAGLKGQIQRRMPGTITVNRYGERFCNEAASYDSSWRTYFAWDNFGDNTPRNVPAYMISDKKQKPNTDVGVQQADTLAELATKLGVDPDGLEATVARFNEHALNGEDPDFHRGESAYDGAYGPTLSPIEKTPFYGVEVAPGDLGTCGGVRVNGSAQALDAFGKIIDRLYAAGNNAGVGGPGAGYGGGGGTIGPALTFAYIAGAHAATLEPLSLAGDEAQA